MRDLAFAVGAQDQQACIRLGACHVTEQVERGGVGPLQIVEKEQQAVGSSNGSEKHAHSLIEAQARLFGRQWVTGREFPQA